VVLSGATGQYASAINGVFEPTGEEHNSKPLLGKVGDPGWWLRCTPSGSWVVSRTASKEANDVVGECYSAERGLAHPTLATGWEVAKAGKFVAEAGMTATVSA
jgi:hypothetical protein